MALRARYAKLSDVPQELKTLYRAADKAKGDESPAVLDVEAADGFNLVDANALLGKISAAEAERQRVQARLKDYQIDETGTLMSGEQLQAMLREHAALKEAAGKHPDAKEVEKRIAEAEARGKTVAEKRAIEAQKTADKLRAAFAKSMRELEAESALSEVRVLPERRKLMLRELSDLLTTQEENEQIHVRVRAESGDGYRMSMESGQTGPMTPTEAAKQILRQNYPDFFAGDGASGAGINQPSRQSPGSGQFRISSTEARNNPAAYRQMRDAAAKAGQSVEVVS